MKKTLLLLLSLLMFIALFTTIASAAEEEPLTNRGCTACHVKYSADKDYTLYAEAKLKGGDDHPTKAPGGIKLNEKTTVDTCLKCHGASKNGRGKRSPYSLRDIVHPAHMFSSAFKEKLNGGCFSCHNVEYDGSWVLIPEKIKTNKNGIPKVRPVANAIDSTSKALVEKPKPASNKGLIFAIILLGIMNVITLGISLSKRK